MMAPWKVHMNAARTHCPAAPYPYLPPDAASLHIAAPWGATLVQLYFLPALCIYTCFERPMCVVMGCHHFFCAAAPCIYLCTLASPAKGSAHIKNHKPKSEPPYAPQ